MQLLSSTQLLQIAYTVIVACNMAPPVHSSTTTARSGTVTDCAAQHSTNVTATTAEYNTTSYVSMTLVNPDFLKRIFSPESVRVHFRV